MAPCARQRSFFSAFVGISAMHSATAISKNSCENEDFQGITRPFTALVQRYVPEIEKRCRLHLKTTTDSWRVDETCVKVKGEWISLSRAVDSQGNTLEFLLSVTHDAQAAKRFFAKTLRASHTVTPRVITVDKNAAYPKALKEMKATGDLAVSCELRQSKYLNTLIEQDHRFIKRLVKPGMGFFSFQTAWRTLQGYEVMHMIKKGQVQKAKKGEITSQVAFIAELFGVAA
jgi:transposase, IS6 family